MAKESFESVVTPPKTVFTPYLPKSATEKALEQGKAQTQPTRRGGGGGQQSTQANITPIATTGQTVESVQAQTITQKEILDQKIKDAIQSGAIQGFSGRLMTEREQAKAQLLTALESYQKKQSIKPPEQYGEYIAAATPQGQQLLMEQRKALPLKEQ